MRGDKDVENCSLVFGVEDGENGEDIREIEGREGSVSREMVDVGIGVVNIEDDGSGDVVCGSEVFGCGDLVHNLDDGSGTFLVAC